MAVPAIECTGVGKRFGEHAAVDDVTLRVEPGEAFGFLGPNGAGKTTLIRLLLGFLRPSGGTSAVFGHDSWREQVAVHRLVGNLPGDFTYDDRMTGSDVVAHVARLRGLGNDRAALAHAAELADRLHADLERPLRSLSRGNLQKVGLIQALFHRPRLLLLDEPTTGLDPLMQRRFVDLIAEARADGATLFLSSHNLHEVEHVCERVGIIRDGRLVATEQVDELVERALRQVRVRFDGEPPLEPLAALPGASDLTREGEWVHLRASGSLQPLIALLAAHPVADLEIERASLDDLFASFYGSER